MSTIGHQSLAIRHFLTDGPGATTMAKVWFDRTAELPAHTRGVARGEELVRKLGREAGRDNPQGGRTARDATSINADAREPIDPRMPTCLRPDWGTDPNRTGGEHGSPWNAMGGPR